MGEKFAGFLQYTSAFISGYIIGFVSGWRVALVMMAVAPLVHSHPLLYFFAQLFQIAVCGAFLMKATASLSTKGQKVYSRAGAVATEVFSSIRTVASLGGGKRELNRYTNKLDEAKIIGIK